MNQTSRLFVQLTKITRTDSPSDVIRYPLPENSALFAESDIWHDIRQAKAQRRRGADVGMRLEIPAEKKLLVFANLSMKMNNKALEYNG